MVGEGVLVEGIEALGATSAALGGEIEAVMCRVSVFKSASLELELVSERGRALLSMSEPDDYVVMVNPATGKPVSGSGVASTTNELSSEIERGID